MIEDATNEPVEVLHRTQKADSSSPVQRLLARSGGAIYLSFRGTTDVQDVAIDVGAVPDYHRFKEHGIGVHGGIARTLKQDGEDVEHVLNSVLDMRSRHR